MLYAASDEFHQSFVPTRTPLVSDVLIDTAGGAIGLLALWLIRPLAKTLVKSNMKRPLVAVVSCYAAGLLLAANFPAAAGRAVCRLVFRPRSRPRPRKTPPVFDLAAPRARRLDESRSAAPPSFRQTICAPCSAMTPPSSPCAELWSRRRTLKIVERDGQETEHSLAQVRVTELRRGENWQPAAGEIIVTTPGTLAGQFFRRTARGNLRRHRAAATAAGRRTF